MSIMQITQTVRILPPLQARRSKPLAQPVLPGLEPEPAQAPKITNRQIAEVLAGIADMLTAQNGNPYRIQAYRNGARGVLDLQESATDIVERGEELPIPGIGERLRSHILELVQLGSVTINNGICLQTLPAGVISLLTIYHVGPYTAVRLYEELGIDSIEKLIQAADEHRIRTLAGFGLRSEARLRAAAERALQQRQASSTTGGAA
ncbi:MAG TPA: helix-hairpin-helix domain-containing protein [Dictyobacter sp.]|nr:helix-hairpin-helix domain-containing protein [Dictyobacter sp.]